jgi:hypothetical protein
MRRDTHGTPGAAAVSMAPTVAMPIARAIALAAALACAFPAAADDQHERDLEPVTTGSSEELTWSEQFYPLAVGNVLYFRARENDKPDEQRKIKAEIKSVETKDGVDYFYFYAPEVDARYLIRRDADGVYMRVIKFPFPLFKFSIKVDIEPELRFIKFPLEVGATWEQESRASARILFVPRKEDLHARFEVVKKDILHTDAGEIEAYLVHAWVARGDGEPDFGQFWYAKGIGYAFGETVEYATEIVGYRVFDESARVWTEHLPENPEEYE